MSNKIIQIIGMAATFLGFAATVVSDRVGEIKMKQAIKEEVNEQVNEAIAKKEDEEKEEN